MKTDKPILDALIDASESLAPTQSGAGSVEHTPGPWKVQSAAGHISVTCPTQQVAKMINMPNWAEVQANAHLIVAAPSMQDALHRILALSQKPNDEWTCEVIERIAQEAITATENQTP